MMKDKMIGDVPSGTLGTLIDLLSKLRSGSITEQELLKVAKKKSFVGDPLDCAPESVLAALSSLLLKHQQGKISLEQLEILVKSDRYFYSSEEAGEFFHEWDNFYRRILGSNFKISCYQSAAIIPTYQSGFRWLVFIPGNLTLKMIIEACRDEFIVEIEHEELFHNLRHDRTGPNFTSDGSHYFGIRNRVESDQKLVGLSASRIWEQDITSINLIEMLVLQLKYRLDTKQHLNIKRGTVCAGSWLGSKTAKGWSKGALVPTVCSKGDRVIVTLHDPQLKSKAMGVRQIIL